MLKLGKGLKKKKKNKKGKKGEELFTAEELEQYKREHAHKEEQAGTSEEPKESEDFEKFKALTAGVDDFLKKTQGDLDRIKKDSFFQRKLTPSEIKAQEDLEKAELQKSEGNWEGFEGAASQPLEEPLHEEDSGSEFEVDENDDIFDTAYIDQLESGDVKLAYVSDDDDDLGLNDGPDPFDTSTADQLLRKAEEDERVKKKQISLGLAVNVLTGRAERDRAILVENNIVNDSKEEKVIKARPRKIQDFCLLGSFDEAAKVESHSESDAALPEEHLPKSILDDDLVIDQELPEGDALTQILVSQVAKPPPPELATPDETNDTVENLVAEFDIGKAADLEIKKLEEEEEFDEFSALAASSVINQKLEEELKEFEVAEDDPFDTSVVDSVLHTETVPDLFDSIEAQSQHLPIEIPQAATREGWVEIEEPVEDPFDTSFAENCAPGKAEIRLLEKEILEAHIPNPTVRKADILLEARILSRNNSEDLNPRQRVSIQITDPSGETQRGSESDEIVALSLSQRDLLGGSTTDLTCLADEPLAPVTVSPSEELSRYSDPFDTSVADQVSAPGKVELRLIEEELLSDLQSSLQDEDFDPRAFDEKPATKGVSFDIPSPVTHLLDSETEATARPLTPFYAEPLSAESDVEVDPFDTSHVTHLPGKQELRLIEQELEQISAPAPVAQTVHEKLGITSESSGLKHSTSDQDFNPRAEEGPLIVRPPPSRRHSDLVGISQQKAPRSPKPSITDDLFSVQEEVATKVLTPSVEEDISSYLDPFDTSIAENIAPGKAEIKLLEAELVGPISRYTDDDFNPRSDPSAGKLKTVISTTPLIPEQAKEPEDFDPFDTSIADNVAPGKAELRLLESELVG